MAEYHIVLSKDIVDKTILELNESVKENTVRLLGLGYELTKKSIHVSNSDERYLISELGVEESDLGFWKKTKDSKIIENEFYYLVKNEIRYYHFIKLKLDSPLGISMLFLFDGKSFKDIHYKFYGISVDVEVYNKVVTDNDTVQLDINYTGRLYYMVLDKDIKMLNSVLYISQYNDISRTSVDTCFCMTDNKLIDNQMINF